MAIIHRSKKRKIIITILLLTVVVVIGSALVVICSERSKAKGNKQNTEIAQVENLSNIMDSGDATDTKNSTDMQHLDSKENYDNTNNTDSTRYAHYNCISMFSGISIGDLVDIRISFPNGEDYIVVSHKRIVGMDENGVILKMSEEELLRMSSAKIDVNSYEGTYIYAVKYLSDEQKPATSYYLLNEYVLSLCEWNPNLTDKIFSQDNLKKRHDFEQEFVKFQIEKEVG